MSYALLAVAIACAALDWIAAEKRWRRIEYATKPLVMLLLLAWLWQAGGMRGWMVWFVAGMIFSLAGDILLMLPRDLFIGGLAAFLVAQVAYIAGFNSSVPLVTPGGVAVAVVLGIVVWRIYARIAGALKEKNATALAAPLLAYTIVLGLMVLSAMLTFFRPEWARMHALLVSCGGALFLASDGMLAWNRFVAPVPHARLLIMATYHLAQFGIVIGAALHLLG